MESEAIRSVWPSSSKGNLLVVSCRNRTHDALSDSYCAPDSGCHHIQVPPCTPATCIASSGTHHKRNRPRVALTIFDFAFKMAQQQRTSVSRSRVSQRSMRRLTVPALSMSLRSRRAEHPTITLGLPQLDRFHDRAEKALSETIAVSANVQQNVDQAQWKCLRSHNGVRLLRSRLPTATGQIPLLCVGALRGSFEDIMEGIYCQNTEEMLLMNAIKCPRLTESAVLYTVQRQTICEPYAFTGIKWVTMKLSVASNREFCYFDKMGLVRQTMGNRMAYHVLQSVDLPEYPHKAMHKRVQASLCYVFEELEDDLVGVYMQGEMDQAALSYFSTPAMSDLLLAPANAMECTRAKKLAAMMTPPTNWKRRPSRRCCDVCRGSASFFESLQECAGCDFKYVCKKCRVKENVLARDVTSNSHLLRAEFCRVCISKMDSLTIEELRMEVGMTGQRTADMNAAFCEVEEEPEDFDIPGSDRSLTAFTLKISAQLQDLSSSRSDARMSNLSSLEKVSISEDEDDAAEGRDVLNSFGKKSSQIVPFEKDPADTSRRSSRSTASTASSSYYHDDDELEQYRSSLFARLLQVSNQAEATFHLTQKQSLIANSVFHRNRRATQASNGASRTHKKEEEKRKPELLPLREPPGTKALEGLPRSITLTQSMAQTPAEIRKATGGRDVPELIPAPPAKKRKRRDGMPRIWLRLELFELGLVPLPSKYAASLTVGNVKKALDAVHSNFQAAKGEAEAAGGDAVMMDTEGAFTESDNLNSVTFPVWKEAVEGIFQWREQDYQAFWLLLVQFHRMIPVRNEEVDATVPLDAAQCLEREKVPVFKMAIFLFVQTVKPHSWRSKYSLDSFNAVWYREHAESLSAAAALETAGAVAAATAPKSPILGAVGSPRMIGSASPPPPQSPHTVGMADRSTADAYYLSFVREKLEDLFGLLFPSVDLKDESPTVVSADQIDLLGFLLCLGDVSLEDKNLKLSSCYPTWELSDSGDAMAEADAVQEFVPHLENGAKVCRFYKTQLSLNEKMYPPVGFSVAPPSTAQNNLSIPSPPAFSLNGLFRSSNDEMLDSVLTIVSAFSSVTDDFSLDGSADAPAPQEEAPGRPTILSQLVKTTVIKRADEFVVSDNGQRPDVIIFSCQDSYIYLLGPVRYPFNSLMWNCRIILAPNTGILLMERCENVQLTAISGLVRVSNCLDTRLNVYTLSPIVVSGENVGVILGPYNTKYSGLKQQLSTVPFLCNSESQGCWNKFLDVDTDKDSMADTDKPPVSLQVPETFRDVCIPVKPAAGTGPSERPFPIPPEYVAAVRKQYETVEALRQLVTSDEFDLTKKRTMEVVIQLKFKEWLSSTSNVRQILDLVHLDRVNGDPVSKEP
ncbi:TBCC domain-containing protein 1 [Phytophthora citrophthora]|uniref:TBCC domain-containing protein 1 n=1 Tax=Phytophthora citrophthora TaxID=4793 RepID=A0AAD9LHL8_9STRA|nr:TBCC domain-containing protein 1 [Phytophthora citrophthora]